MSGPYDVVRSALFRSDLRRLVERDPSRVEELVAAVEGTAVLLRRFPELGHPLHSPGSGWSMIDRSWSVGRYIIRYRVEHDRQRIVLLRFRHERQRPLKR